MYRQLHHIKRCGNRRYMAERQHGSRHDRRHHRYFMRYQPWNNNSNLYSSGRLQHYDDSKCKCDPNSHHRGSHGMLRHHHPLHRRRRRWYMDERHDLSSHDRFTIRHHNRRNPGHLHDHLLPGHRMYRDQSNHGTRLTGSHSRPGKHLLPDDNHVYRCNIRRHVEQ